MYIYNIHVPSLSVGDLSPYFSARYNFGIIFNSIKGFAVQMGVIVIIFGTNSIEK